VSRWEGALDMEKAKKVLNGEIVPTPEETEAVQAQTAKETEAVPAQIAKEPASEVS